MTGQQCRTRYATTRIHLGLCPNVKVLTAVSRRGLSIDVRADTHRPNPEYPALVSGPRSGRVLGEGGDNEAVICITVHQEQPPGIDPWVYYLYLGLYVRDRRHVYCPALLLAPIRRPSTLVGEHPHASAVALRTGALPGLSGVGRLPGGAERGARRGGEPRSVPPPQRGAADHRDRRGREQRT